MDAIRQVLAKLATGSLNARNETSSMQSSMHPAAPGLASAAPLTEQSPKSPETNRCAPVSKSHGIERKGSAPNQATVPEDTHQSALDHVESQHQGARSLSGQKRGRQDLEDVDVSTKRSKVQAEQKTDQKPVHTTSPYFGSGKDESKIPSPVSQGTSSQPASSTAGNKDNQNLGHRASTTSINKGNFPIVKPAIPSNISRHFPKRPSPLGGPANAGRVAKPQEVETKPQEVEKDEMKQSTLPPLERYEKFKSYFLEIRKRAQQGKATRFEYEQARA
ncbi:MAG: hypothetical protein Q9183_007955, partial [Haloplaca sp. 2 TL-2023]